jgi:hypothetical protein
VRSLTYGFWIVLTSCGTALAQTNLDVPRAWLSLPSAQLQPIVSEASGSPVTRAQAATSQFEAYLNERAATNISDVVWAFRNDLQEEISLNRFAGEFDYRTYRLLHDGGVLKPPTKKADDPFSRIVFEIFEPEPFRIGKTTVGCSLFTAIKRKNPLCLLSPMVLNVSW